MPNHHHHDIMQQACAHAAQTAAANEGGPFGAAIVKDGSLIALASNQVLAKCDPTAHAEIEAIRLAAQTLASHDLSGCELYATGYPCPMCLSAIIWSNIKKVYYAHDSALAAAIGFRDDFIYHFIRNGNTNSSVLDLQQLPPTPACQQLYPNYANAQKPIY